MTRWKTPRLLRVLRYARLARWGREDTRRFWTRARREDV